MTDTQAQRLQREFEVKGAPQISVVNLYGRVAVLTDETLENKVLVSVDSPQEIGKDDISFTAAGNNLSITTQILTGQLKTKKRLDIVVRVPARSRVKIKTESGEVQLGGNIASAEVLTDTGTISTNIPLDGVKYTFTWLGARPKFMSDARLPDPKEKSGGRFVISGEVSQPAAAPKKKNEESGLPVDPGADPAAKKVPEVSKNISLDLRTRRGVILFNVDPKDIRSDLRERELTEAAKGIIRSGDPDMTDAIRIASPKFFGEYARTLPPRRAKPSFAETDQADANSVVSPVSGVKRVNIRVTDEFGRAVNGLTAKDFTILENNRETEVLNVRPSVAPFNLVLLLDVSGSVEDYIDFIRKAARNFLETASEKDRIAIVTFRDDVKVLTNFTTDRKKLSESLDTFEAGGGTAYYDALAFSLVDTLKPFQGDRTAIVILSDGDDNRSFLPFDALIDGIGESGALIYPLYVPSELIAASKTASENSSSDPIRTKYLGLTTRAEDEGARLARVSGGVYYPIRQLSDLQKAYDDVVRQLRTSYMVTFRSNLLPEEAGIGKTSPRVRVKMNRENVFTRLGPLENVSDTEK
ncbi:MAG TPA: VWA domain-containing protein [Pyrinomonadaceae bacterium]|nr:VWA domain-containing protein [Pyrinomonadaceae bacterium]